MLVFVAVALVAGGLLFVAGLARVAGRGSREQELLERLFVETRPWTRR